MTKKEQKSWDNTISKLKSNRYDNIHKLFNVVEGWAYISYKKFRIRIDYSMNWDFIKGICERLVS